MAVRELPSLLDGDDPILEHGSELRRRLFETFLNQVPDGAVLRRILVMAAHFAIGKYAHMVLVFESLGPPEAHDLVGVFPCDEVIPETLLLHEIGDELADRARGVEHADEEILAPLMSHKAEHERDISHIGMERGVETPEPVLYPVKQLLRIRHPRMRQILYPLLFHSNHRNH